jgi:uncharacterized protein (TIGR02246 family)
MTGTTRFALPLAVLLLGCGEGPPSVTGTRMPERAQPTIEVGGNQTDGIEALVAANSAAWAAKNAAAFAATYAVDAEFISPVGGILSGRAAIQAQHVFLFGGPFAATTSVNAVRRVAFLTGTIAIVDIDVTLTGFAGLPPGLRATEPGVVRSRARWVVEKRGGDWLIVAGQMTPLPPA